MTSAHFRFYAELNDFLLPARRGTVFAYEFPGNPSIKDVIESLGVPHGEVDLILANGEPVDFAWQARDGARISVYPVFESLDVSPIARVRPRPLRDSRFILDGHLGRLAAYLRMMGFDVLWRNDSSDEQLAHLSRAEGRILLTRDRELLKRKAVTHGYWVRETNPQRQLPEILQRFDLLRSIAPFRRCLRCNRTLEPIEKELIADRLPARIRERHTEFRICRSCDKIYWKGSHHDRMQRLIDQAVANIAKRTGP